MAVLISKDTATGSGVVLDAKDHADSYIAHYGVPNMKWGVRKYQYEDGRLTKKPLPKHRTENADGGIRHGIIG